MSKILVCDAQLCNHGGFNNIWLWVYTLSYAQQLKQKQTKDFGSLGECEQDRDSIVLVLSLPQ